MMDRIARYKLLNKLGEGGMGEVYLAEDSQLGRSVALKILPAAFAHDRERLRRFMLEARAASSLNHPHVAQIYELGEAEGVNYIAMEWIDGESLGRKLEGPPLAISEIVRIASEIADALAAAHAKGIVHRDIKPANIMLDGRSRAKVLDFGLAKMAPAETAAESDARTREHTREGLVLGTVPYMSPEQALGKPADSSSDIFSFGVVMYEMLAGRRPFQGKTQTELIDNIVHQTPDSIGRFNHQTPAELDRIVRKCLEKESGRRYRSAEDLHIDLLNLQRGDGAASPPPLKPSRNRGIVAVAVLAGIALAGALYFASGLQIAPRASAGFDSLAVLPLVNAGGRAENEYLADGITESLIHNMSRVPGVKVMSRNTVFRFKGKEADARAVAKELGVKAVLMGSLKQLGERLVIDVELIDAGDGSILYSQQYVRNAPDVIAMQTEIAQDVAEGLRIKLSGELRRSLAHQPTNHPEAYKLYLKGRFFANKSTPEGLHEAIVLLQQAVALDPEFALALSDISQSYLTLGLFFESAQETMPLAKEFAQKALRIDPDLDDAHVNLGLVALVYDWNWIAAEREMSAGARLNPKAVETFSCAAHLLESAGREIEGEREIRRALLADPLSIPLNTELGCISYYQRRYDLAIKDYGEALALDPGNPVAYWGLGQAYAQKKMHPQAIEELKKAVAPDGAAPPIILAELGYVYAAQGDRDAALAAIGQLIALDKGGVYVDPYLIAGIQAGLENAEGVFEYLEKAFSTRSAFMISIKADPKWDPFRSDPRFLGLLRRIGFPPAAG